MLRIVFMGSPDFAVPALRALIASQHEVVLVVTQPDKPAGRGKKLVAPPVKLVAKEAGIPIVQPQSARKPEFAAELAKTGADLGVVVAYGKILPRAVLDAFVRGCINIHGSLLPAYRGAAPIQWALIHGESTTGVTIMSLDEGMDTGPMLVKRTVEIGPDDTAGDLFSRLADVGAEALLDALDGITSGTVTPIPQPDDGVSYAPMLKKEDGIIDWTQPAAKVACRIRGVDPWPGARTTLDGSNLKLFGARIVADGKGSPGEVLSYRAGLVVACGQGAVRIAEVQLAGRKRMSVSAFSSGRPIAPGTVLGL